ncbi:hypothetical protein Fot_35771 [Forsythia ovata]|uniref:Uncharacterized protein n=1 Tax=Forsythia ovata TaxID=205694 RepID=A0ABD1SQB4_9LAMI
MAPESHPAAPKVSHLTDLTTCSSADPSPAPVPRTQNKPKNDDDEEFIEPKNIEYFASASASAFNADEDNEDDGDEIIPVQDTHLENLGISLEIYENNVEIIEEEVVNVINLKPLKDHIDLDTQVKKSSGGRFWAAASVFSKKWKNLRSKQKMKKQNDGENSGTFPVEKPITDFGHL